MQHWGWNTAAQWTVKLPHIDTSFVFYKMEDEIDDDTSETNHTSHQVLPRKIRVAMHSFNNVRIKVQYNAIWINNDWTIILEE